MSNLMFVWFQCSVGIVLVRPACTVLISPSCLSCWRNCNLGIRWTHWSAHQTPACASLAMQACDAHPGDIWAFQPSILQHKVYLLNPLSSWKTLVFSLLSETSVFHEENVLLPGFASGSSKISGGCRSRRVNILGHGLPVAASRPGLLRQWAMSDSKSSEPQMSETGICWVQ